jgi:hypothetical protein
MILSIIGRVVSGLLSLLIMVICLSGMINGLSFEDWIPLDIIMALLLAGTGLIGQASLKKDEYDENQIIVPNLSLIVVMVAAFMMHAKLWTWTLIDLAIIIVNIWTIYHLIKPKC